MIKKEVGYTYKDLSIVPDVWTKIESRKEVNPFICRNNRKYLPIFASPMSTVVDDDNYMMFHDVGILPIIPRNIDWAIRLDLVKKGEWVSFSLSEFEKLFIENANYFDYNKETVFYHVCIDMANGHMLKLIDTLQRFNDINKEHRWTLNMKIIIGNIANPDTFKSLCRNQEYLRIWGVRCGIGTGKGCITTSDAGVGYPIASLINECRKIKGEFLSNINIIADGGIRDYSDAIIALACGADYVMIGGLFAQAFESAGRKHGHTKENIVDYSWDGSKSFLGEFKQYKNNGENNWMVQDTDDNIFELLDLNVKFYGMASTEGMQDMNIQNWENKTPEGIVHELPVLYRLVDWVEKFTDYLRSAMSYTNCSRIEDFNSGEVELIPMSPRTQMSINLPTR